MNDLNNQRIETLDWLRGLMALSIMFYHLISWTFYDLDSSNPLGRLGVYGVSIFFILSGLSMAIVYNSYIKDAITSFTFFIRRIFRIWPLLWVVILLNILPYITKLGIYDLKIIFINITTLFGFIKPTSYIATGSWSIGNEMVYYALTPLIIISFNFKKWLGNAIFFISILIGLFFSFFLLRPNLTLSQQWSIYVNPFNNLFLYIAGMAIYYNLKNVSFSNKINIGLLFSAIILFCLLPFKGNQISIVYGIGRIVFVLLSLLVVFCFYKLKANLPIILKNFLISFGLATYGVYLFHPIIYFYVNMFLNKINFKSPILVLCLVPILTFFVSKYSYKYFESKLTKVGKQLTFAIMNKKIYEKKD